MSDTSYRPEGYEDVLCEFKFKGCKKNHAGYCRRRQYAQSGPWLNACENCARVPYDPPPQFQEATNGSGKEKEDRSKVSKESGAPGVLPTPKA